MTSSVFDAVLLVTDPALTTLFALDDDSGGGTNASLFYSFEAGAYIVWATSFKSGSTGAYRLTSEMVEVESCDTPVGSVALNESVTDSLSLTSCRRNGAISDPWLLSLSADARLSIALTSPDFDTMLEVTDSTGQTVATDDDGLDGTNSLVIADFGAGEYTVWVTSYGGGEVGAYSLAVSEVVSEELFLQPPEDNGVNYGSPQWADDFVLNEAATLQELRWWGSDGDGTTATVRLFADNGIGAPQIFPFYEVLNPVVQSTPTDVVPRGLGPVYENRVAFSSEPLLHAGIRYYVSISGPGSWLSSTAPGSEWWSRSQDSEAWRNAAATNPNNLAFQLFGVAPGIPTSEVHDGPSKKGLTAGGALRTIPQWYEARTRGKSGVVGRVRGKVREPPFGRVDRS
jgi:hypothetical protein